MGKRADLRGGGDDAQAVPAPPIVFAKPKKKRKEGSLGTRTRTKDLDRFWEEGDRGLSIRRRRMQLNPLSEKTV